MGAREGGRAGSDHRTGSRRRIGGSCPVKSACAGCLRGVSADCVAVVEGVETRFAMLGEDHIAYQVMGDGPVDLLLEVAIGYNNVELVWEVAACARVFERLASFSRLIRFD